jgi:hypothetical protein
VIALHPAHAAEQKEIADIAFFDLALDAGRPHAIGADEPVQQPVVALRRIARRVPLHAPLVFHANADVGEFLIGGEIAAFRGELPFFVAHDVEHFLLHQDHALLLGDALARSRPFSSDTHPSAPAAGRRGGAGSITCDDWARVRTVGAIAVASTFRDFGFL